MRCSERLDFGPSRWKILDNSSTNGLFVNGQRVSEHELADSDTVTVGDFDLKFVSINATEPDPSPGKSLPPGAPSLPRLHEGLFRQG